MLILLQKAENHGGFFLKRKAKQGKLPPAVRGIRLGKYPCVLLECYGDITPGNRFLAPYLRRGDLLVPACRLEKLGFAEPYVEELTRRQCVNAAKTWVAKREKGVQTVLADPVGNCVGVAAEFCALGSALWVATPRAQEYAPCAEYCMLTFGNPPVIGSYIPPSADLVIAPYGVCSAELPRNLPVVSPNHIWAKPQDLTIPGEIADCIPHGFDPIAVAAGCFAMFGVGMEEKALLFLPNEK